MKRRVFLSSAVGFLFSIGVLKSKYIIGGSFLNPGSEWLLFLSMDVEEVGKLTKHIPKAISSVGRSLDFLEDNLDIKAKFTFFVTEGSRSYQCLGQRFEVIW
jgi:hypothetical protein